MHWLYHFLGLDNLSGSYYGFWSGVGSDLTELAIVGGLISMVRKNNCHHRWCPYIGHHEYSDPATGLTYKLCRLHHPDHPGRRQRNFTKELS